MNAPTWRIREGVRLLQRASHLWFAVANGDERSWHERHARQHASLCRVGVRFSRDRRRGRGALSAYR